MTTGTDVRPFVNGRVIGLGLGQFRFAGRGGVALLIAAMLTTPVLAGPEGAKVAAGQATITQRGNRTVIRASNKAIIDYTRFNIGANESVRFVQPSATSTVLNRISSAAPTKIDGALKSNGIVYFANKAGVIFGPTATVDVGGIYAAAGSISNRDFMRGMNRFTDLSGEVANHGTINAGVAALVGQHVTNAGTINSPGGVVAMVAGNDVVLSERGGLFSVKVDQQALAEQAGASAPIAAPKPGVDNSGTINAPRGRATMVAGDMYALAVRNTGTVKARNIDVRGGKTGMVEVAGRLDARNQGQGATGGSITVTGENIHVHNAVVDASGKNGGGDVRIGGDAHGGANAADPLRTAANVQVDANATVRADATQNGDGGSVVVWSDNRTNFYGTASASGGVEGGDGGFIETSGKISLDVRGATIRASSETGKAGLWLMDPVNVTITNAATNGGTFDGGSPTDTFNPDNSVSPAIVDSATVVSALENGTNVTITTGSVGSDPGNITVAAPIAMTNAPGGMPADPTPTLTLNAANNITISSGISSSGAALPLNVDLQAGGAVAVNASIITGGGSFSSTSSGGGFSNSGSISTGGGNIIINHAGSVVSLGNTLGAGGGNISISGLSFSNVLAQIQTGGGDATLTFTGPVQLNAAVTTDGGNFVASGTNFVSTGTGTITTLDGDVTLNFSGNVNVGQAIDAGNGVGSTSAVTITAATLNPTGMAIEGIDAAITAGSGGITLRPSTASSTINLGAGSGGFDVSVAELGNLNIIGFGRVTVGRPDASGNFNIGPTPVNLAALGYQLYLDGGTININSQLTGPTNQRLILIADSIVDANGSGTDITVGGAGGTLEIVSLNTGVGASSAVPFEIDVANLGNSFVGGNLFLNNAGALTTGSLTVTGNADVRASGAIQAGVWTISGSTVVWTRSDSGADIFLNNAANSFGGVVTVRSRQQTDDTMVSSGAITIVSGGALSLGQVETTGAVALQADGNIVLNNPGTGFVRFGNGLTLTTANGGSVDLPRVIAGGGQVAIDAQGAGANVLLTTLSSSTAALTVANGSQTGGNLTLTSGFGDLTVPNMVVGGSNASFSTTQDDADISVATITGANNFNLSTVSPGNTGHAALESAGNMVLTSDVQGELTLTSGGNMSVTSTTPLRVAAATASGFANFIAPDAIITGPISAGAGGIVLQPDDNTDTVGINSATGDFQLTEAELQNLSTTGTVTIGRSAGTGAIDIGGLGAIDVSAAGYDLTLRGGQASFTNGITLANDALMTFQTAGIVSPGAGTDITIGGADGRVLIDNSGGSTLTISAAKVAGTTSAGGIDITSAGATQITSIGSVDGLTAANNENVSVVATTGDLQVDQAVNVTGTGNITLGSDAGSVVFGSTGTGTAGSSGAITVNADQNITAPAGMGNVLTAGTLNLTATNGSIGNGNTLRTAAANISADGKTGVDITNTGDLTATLASAMGTAKLANTGTLTTGGAWAADALDIDSTGNITLAHNVTGSGATGVDIASSGGSLTIGNGVTLSSSNNAMALSATDLIIDATGAITSGTGSLAISRSTGGKIFIGDVTAATGSDMAISNAELGSITSASMTLGGVNTTEIIANGVDGPATANIDLLTLDATDDNALISFTGADSTFKALIANADDGITVDTNLAVTGGALSLNGDFDNATDSSDKISVAAGKTISTAGPMGGDITLVATTGGIMGAGALTIDSNAGLTISSAITAMGQLMLSANGGIVLSGPGSGQTVTISADNGVTLSDDVTNSSGNTVINADANADGTGTLTLASGKTITTTGNDLAITAADLDLQGSINAGAGVVTVARSSMGTIGLGSAAGDMSITDAEFGRITARSLSIGNTLTTLISVDSVSATGTANIAETITLLADDVNVAGAFNTNVASLVIGRANSGTLGIGNAVGDMTISNAELANITTQNLTLGGIATQNVTVNGVMSASTANVAGTVTLISGNTLTFSGASNTFKALTARADNGIVGNSNLTTTVGDLSLDGDFDNAADSNDGIVFGSNRTIASAGLLTLKSTTGGITGLGTLTLNAADGITALNDITTSGVTTVNADTDADGMGVLTVSSGRTLSTSGNNLTISASDLVLDGSINTGGGSASITRASAGTIGLGTATGDMTISGAEFGRVIATGLTIGGSTITGLTANGLTNANTNGIAGTTNLRTGNAGTITFDSTNVFNALNAASGAGLTVNGALTTDTGNLSLDGDSDNSNGANDVITLKANVTAPNTSNINFGSKVVLGANIITIAGKDVSFTDDVNSDSTARSLEVNSANSGVTTFGAGVGNVNALSTLETNVDGITRIGGLIRTVGTIAFLDDVRLTNDSTVRAAGGSGILFGGGVDTANSSPTARSLTVVGFLNTSSTATNISTINFGGPVGSVKALKNVYLNYDPTSMVNGRENVPAVATIVIRAFSDGSPIPNPTTPPAALFNLTGDFIMGQNEKLTSAGSLTINAASAVFGDLTSVGNMTINAPTVVFNRRAASQIAVSAVQATNPSGLDPLPDRGVDVVSGGTMTFNSSSVTAQGNASFSNPSFSSAAGVNSIVGPLSGFLLQSYPDPITVANINRIVTVSGQAQPPITLDLQAEGPSNADLATSLAGAIPRESRMGDVGQDATIAQAQIDQLKNLGVFAREPREQELLALLQGSATYDDVPRRPQPVASDYTTVVNRLPSTEVDAMLASYDALFNKPKLDENGNPVLGPDGKALRVNRSAEIQESLFQSVRRFRAAKAGAAAAAPADGEAPTPAPAARAATFDPYAFRAYLEQTPEEAQSLAYIRQIGAFLDQLSGLGLTPRELNTSKAAILSGLRPRGIPTTQQLEAVIRADTSQAQKP